MEKDIIKAGFSSIEDFFLKVVLPTTVLTLIAFFAFMLYVPLPIYFSYVVLIFGFSFVLIIPYMMIERNKIEINENIHLFITYAGTISTIDLDRKKFFEQLSHSDQYGLISRISEKILYFAKRWNLGFARTCRKIAKSSPSRIFGDFLDRFAAALDFGEPMDVFMKDEQHAVLDDYETMYNESLNNIGMMREAFIAITISLAFGMSTALLMPLLMGISIIVAVKWSLFATFFIDVLLFIFAAAFIPSDDLLHDMKLKDKGMIRIYRSLFWTVPLSLFIMFVLFWFGWLSFLFNVAIGLTPMLYTGYLANQHENQLFKRDKEFPAFIRALGATIFARQGGVLSSLEALQVHDFGSLQEIVNNLYTRLKIQSDKLKSWKYFAAESGSKLISKFSLIFSESIYLGGHARQIGEMISSNFQRLIALRKLRYQQASALRVLFTEVWSVLS